MHSVIGIDFSSVIELSFAFRPASNFGSEKIDSNNIPGYIPDSSFGGKKLRLVYIALSIMSIDFYAG